MGSSVVTLERIRGFARVLGFLTRRRFVKKATLPTNVMAKGRRWTGNRSHLELRQGEETAESRVTGSARAVAFQLHLSDGLRGRRPRSRGRGSVDLAWLRRKAAGSSRGAGRGLACHFFAPSVLWRRCRLLSRGDGTQGFTPVTPGTARHAHLRPSRWGPVTVLPSAMPCPKTVSRLVV